MHQSFPALKRGDKVGVPPRLVIATFDALPKTRSGKIMRRLLGLAAYMHYDAC